MLFNWFDTKEASAMGVKLADDLTKNLAKANNKHFKKNVKERTQVVEATFLQVNKYKQNVKLNFYKKSKLLNEFKWRLTELGHDEEFVDMMTRELVIYIK